MTTKRKIEYCTLDIEYPKTAFICFLFYLKDSLPQAILRISHIFTSKDEASYYIGKYIESARAKIKLEIHDITILIPLYFQSLYPLKKEYWRKPTQKYEDDSIKLMRVFFPVLEKPEFYKLLVTPLLIQDNKWIFRAAAPFLISADKSVIERFLLTSDWTIDTRVKNAALYTFGEPSSFNWKTKEIIAPEREIEERMVKPN